MLSWGLPTVCGLDFKRNKSNYCLKRAFSQPIQFLSREQVKQIEESIAIRLDLTFLEKVFFLMQYIVICILRSATKKLD